MRKRGVAGDISTVVRVQISPAHFWILLTHWCRLSSDTGTTGKMIAQFIPRLKKIRKKGLWVDTSPQHGIIVTN